MGGVEGRGQGDQLVPGQRRIGKDARGWEVLVKGTDEQRTMVRLTNPEVLLATAAVGASPELASVARDASERMARVTSTLKQTHGVGGH